MKKSLLIVVEQFVTGGLETHIRTEATALMAAGWEVHLATGQHCNHNMLPSGLASVHTGLSLQPEADTTGLLDAAQSLREIVREHAISHLHIHPFSCIIPAIMAAEQEGIAYALTLHGPSSFSGYGPFYEFLLRNVVLPNCGLTTVVSPELMALASPCAAPNTLVYLPNAVAFGDELIDEASPRSTRSPSTSDPCSQAASRWLLISRLDAQKAPGLREFIQKAATAGIANITVVGDGPAAASLQEWVQQEAQAGRLPSSSTVYFAGAKSRITEDINAHTGIAGMGRVVLEGIAHHKPVMLVGYDGVKGLLDESFLSQAANTNFSGRGLPTLRQTQFEQALANVAQLDTKAIYLLAKRQFDQADVVKRFEKKLTTIPKTKPSLMARFHALLASHTITDTTPWLHSAAVIDLLGSLLASPQAHDPARSAAYLIFRQKLITDNAVARSSDMETCLRQLDQQLGHQEQQIKTLISCQKRLQEQQTAEIQQLQQQLAERDQQLVERDQRLAKCLSQIDALHASTSWRITTPLRLAKLTLSGTTPPLTLLRAQQYQLLKALYWKLPAWLRSRLNGYRHNYVAQHLKNVASTAQYKPEQSANVARQALTAQPEWIHRTHKSKQIAIVPCAFEFDDLVNQRPINAAKHYANNGYLVLYIAWQWSPSEVLTKGRGEVASNIFQIPMYEFFAQLNQLEFSGRRAHYLITLPSQAFLDVISTLRRQAVTVYYDIMDEWEEFQRVGQAPWYEKALERRLILEADIVTAVSPALAQKFAALRRDIHVIGNGYTADVLGLEHRNIARKPAPAQKSTQEAGSCAATSNACEAAVIGYFGHLTDAWFDWKSVFQLASSLPDTTFEIIGYGQPDWVDEKAKHFSNVHLLGKVLPAKLHEYVARWSVGLIPFIHSALAEAVDPIKIYEYLYFGLPVVVTGIPHLSTVPRTFYATPETLLDMTRNAMSDSTTQAEVDTFLARTTWQARFDTLIQLDASQRGIGALYEH
ncbi:hypothetical protein HDN1F_06940 [gamma proteobacterium HdN1]|nr:hypothetical protein HDN1F_06940 [gamma proteobacterium HdN1]